MRFMVFVRSPRSLAVCGGDALLRAGVLLDAGDLVAGVCGVSGYWLIDVRDREEAVERVRRIPLPACVVEIRQVAVV
ncbi:YCII-related domain-containing protein [Lentzea fradiae]|uniref:YCII-related domain-containing protein n=1 Tax=Lentzea fradiae TaxID=200378 RepID=A0A1G7WA04_9PSEU|nr:YciI family protein [Lentzea fradiae]SDG68803.1 YCII-related domain-containing protein [Lentzea fradiae]